MKKGFTLLEILVAAGVMAFVSVIVAQVFFSSIHINTKTEIMKEVKQSGSNTLDVMKRMIQNAKTIASTCDDSSVTPKPIYTSLTITGIDGGTTILTCVDDAVAGVARIASESATTMYLTSQNITLADTTGQVGCGNNPLVFTCTSVGGIPDSVTISFSLRQKQDTSVNYEQSLESFETTATVRNQER